MILNRLSILNYKNIAEAQLEFSPKVNGFIGRNGMGKTNVLDAIYFLSFCHSAQSHQDSLAIKHDAPFFVIQGDYGETGAGVTAENGQDGDGIEIYCGMKRGQKKHFRRDKKEYKRLSEHIGLLPLVMVSPGDTWLVEGGSEERRRLLDMVAAQVSRPYIDALNRYNKALLQRNTMLKQEDGLFDHELMDILEEQMASEGEAIYRERLRLVGLLEPLFQRFYRQIASDGEEVGLFYVSHCQRGSLLEVIRRDRNRDLAVGYSLHGVHKDDLQMMLNGHPMRREGSQGQLKTYVVALKLAQFALLRETVTATKPILLLDDIFDKLDAERVERIVKLVSGEDFGQIFVTDTNRDHLDQLLQHIGTNHRLFYVEDGKIMQQDV